MPNVQNQSKSLVNRSSYTYKDISYLFARAIKRLRPSAQRRSCIANTAAIEPGCQVVSSIFGRYSYCGYDCIILNVDVGSFCSIADNVFIGGSQHPIHHVSTSPAFLNHRDSIRSNFSKFDYYDMPRTMIGNDVWIGYGARIRAGVSIGHGAVIAMGAVVTKDVPPYSIAAGNPARIIRKRFDDEVIDSLLDVRWWELSDSELSKWSAWFNDPNAFLKQWSRK